MSFLIFIDFSLIVQSEVRAEVPNNTGTLKREEQNEYARSVFRDNLKGLDAYARHKKFMRDYVHFYGNRASTSAETVSKTELDILKENHKFLRTADDDENMSWEQRVAKKYYDKLFKEYCIVELKYYKQGKIALRWRIEKEVISGKGQFICASTRCSEREHLRSWEINFAYVEDNQKKNALVKIRLCPSCSDKLNYEKKHNEIQSKPKDVKPKEKRGREEYEDDNNSKAEIKRESEDESSVTNKEESGMDKKRKYTHELPDSKEESSNIWSQPIIPEIEKTTSEEYDEFFAGLFE
ncbi:3070_t:CDS:2 [Paraglomus brasilianum]|uniref:3070_t:CDS:1 n=1 Tax=Paraglomus brasilianum TaxID=144538 RepID=A0A9N8WRI4_9GLOM|nr:3070_t:CDS:2 [Paraglomus brasilianum]